jgi:hypothetical protein
MLRRRGFRKMLHATAVIRSKPERAIVRLGWFQKVKSETSVVIGRACFTKLGDATLKRPEMPESCASFARPLEGSGEPNSKAAMMSHDRRIAAPGVHVRQDHGRVQRRRRLTATRTASPSNRMTVANDASRNASDPRDR